MRRDSEASVLEFFAGGGMARLGLGDRWRVIYANDRDPAKQRAYQAAFGPGELDGRCVRAVAPEDVPGRATLAWASFPCQDLSLAGGRGGLEAERSGAFWGFWRLMRSLETEGRAPPIIALENVVGLLSANRGADFVALCAALAEGGYGFGALELDAAAFTPQSRPRVFVVACRTIPPAELTSASPTEFGHTTAVRAAASRLEGNLARRWIWWRLPAPPPRRSTLQDVIDRAAPWDPPAKTARLLSLMAPRHAEEVARRSADGRRRLGALFLRIRTESGERRQRAEPRFDGLAGCLRTPAGGSSRQVLLAIEGPRVTTRLFTPREAARLMGLPESYPLPATVTAALQLIGDGVAPPVVRHLSRHLLEPLAQLPQRSR